VRFTLLFLPLIIGLTVFASVGLASCNITDETFIWSGGTLTANESPCLVNDTGIQGVIIINGSDINIDCDANFNLTGSGAAGIVITGSRVNLSGCKAAGYTSSIKVTGSQNSLRGILASSVRLEGLANSLIASVVDSVGVNEFDSIIRNITAKSISILGDANATRITESIINGGIGIQHGWSDKGYHQIINNTIFTTGNGISISAALGGIPNIIRGNKISADPSLTGTSCIRLEIGANGQTIENNNLSCYNCISDNPYAGRNNIITGNDFRCENALAFGSISGHGACGNQIWNNRFWNKLGMAFAPPWPGCQPNIFNITPTPGTNIIGGSLIAGNWWGEYPGEDLDGDGIGDTNLPFNNDSAPLVLPPIVYEDCNLNNLTVNKGETVHVRRCTISGHVNLTSYGRLYINDSSVGNITTGENSVLRLFNVSGGALEANGVIYVTNASLADSTINGRSEIVESNFGDATISGPSEIDDSGFGALTVSDSANITSLVAASLTLSGSNSVCRGLEISGALTISGEHNDVSGNFGSIVLNGNYNNITGSTNSFSINGDGNIISRMNLDNPQINGANTIRDSNITGGVGIISSGASLINNTITGTDSCLNWVPSGICLRNTGGTNVSIINNTITVSLSGSVRGIDSGFTTLDNAEISGNEINVQGGYGSECIYVKGGNSRIRNNKLDCQLGSEGSIIYMKEGSESVVEGNEIEGHNGHRVSCIKLYSYTKSNYSSNRIVNCDRGVYLDSGVEENTFWNNYFHNSNDIVGLGAENNTWNVTKRPGTNIVGGPWIAGNWWWTYTGEDLDGDNIGDTDLPHELDMAPLLALPEIWSDCEFNISIDVGVARSLLIRNCTIGVNSVSIGDYGRLIVENSRLMAGNTSWNMSSGIWSRVNITNSNLTKCNIVLSNKKLAISDSIVECDISTSGGVVDIRDSKIYGKVNMSGASGADIDGVEIVYNGTGLLISNGYNGTVRNLNVTEAMLSNGAGWEVSGLVAEDVWWETDNSTLRDSKVSNIVRLGGDFNSISGLVARGVKITGSYNNVTYGNFSGGVDFGWNYGPGNMLAHSFLENNIITMTQSPGQEPLKIINNTIIFDGGRAADLEGNSFGIALRGGIHSFMVLDNSEIVNNSIFSNNEDSWCVHVKGSKNLISGNEMRCQNDLRLGYDLPAKRNNITRNTFGGKVGIKLKHSETAENLIWDNKFESQSNVGAEDGALLNASWWNVTKTNASALNMTNIIGGPWIAGNWWNDYQGVDEDGDGIGDTNLPHKGPTWQEDWMPLTNARPQQGDGSNSGFVPGEKNESKKKNETDEEHKSDKDESEEEEDSVEIDVPGAEEDESVEVSVPDTIVVQIVITPSKRVPGIHIIIKKLPEKPAEVDRRHGAVYQYLEISKNVTDEEIKEAVIKFLVDRDWLERNGFNPDKIKLIRWNNGRWEKLPTKREGCNENKEKCDEYFDIDEDEVKVKKGGKVRIKVLGSAFTYWAGGPNRPVYVWRKIGNGDYEELFNGENVNTGKVGYYSEEIEVQSGDVINIRAKGRLTIDTETGGKNVIVLRDGDTPPYFKPFGNQPEISSFLSPVMDPETGKVSIGPNDVLYLFELGQTRTSAPGFDMQDLVVLVTYETPEENSYTYSAVSEGFSYFAIVAEVPESTEVVEEVGQSPTGAFLFGYQEIIIGTGFVILAVILVVFARRELKSRRRAPWRASLRS